MKVNNLFTTLTAILLAVFVQVANACTTPTGLSVTPTSTTALISWTAVEGATAYRVIVEDGTGNPIDFTASSGTITATSWSVTGLTEGAAYKYKVRSVCGTNTSNWSAWTAFSATTGGSGGGPCTLPSGLTVAVSGTSATITWTAVPAATGYRLVVEDGSGNPVDFSAISPTVTGTSWTVNGLTAAAAYKYKIRTVCASGTTSWSAWITFNATTGGGGGACLPPTNLAAGNVSSTAADLTWTAAAAANLGYRIEVQNVTDLLTPYAVATNINTNAYTATGLTPSTTYKFKVRSRCTGTQSSWTATKTFTTPAGLNDPSTEITTPVAAAEFKLSPNPATTTLHVTTPTDATLALYTTTGTRVIAQNITPGTNTLDISTLPQGLYIIRVTGNDLNQSQQVIIAH